ncbi:hypothetical protein [Mycobacterium bourgelatii]|uniref:Short-chain dehydrogenase n=1 Tax=Mycobacterium bourgelatii TaxID=1273442 RepID=A0A7I9YLG4_MYCBU|nr:hypothetical protein [Mycobacterium bourgelatii]MCV6978086.1 hypothetical protein [Mycobacterium bourgelatii]GFG89467.1 hypothetical protein MBOU_15090 [Mycobacterium bourgelatii]
MSNWLSTGCSTGLGPALAEVVIGAVESNQPPSFLLLGRDVLGAHRHLADAHAKEIAAWEQVTVGTDFDS